MIIPFPPGGATDIVGRVLAQKLGDQLGQSVVVENRPGAGGAIGSEMTAKAAPDGYTIQMATVSTHSIGPALNPKTPYDVKRDFAPVIHLANTPNVLIASPVLPINNLKELIAYAKANPGKLNFSSSGNGTIVHMTGEMFKMETGTFIVHIPYKGTALAIPDLIAGQIAFMFDNLSSALPHIKGGKLKTLGVSQTSARRCCPTCPPWTKPVSRVSRATLTSAYSRRQGHPYRSCNASMPKSTRRCKRPIFASASPPTAPNRPAARQSSSRA